MLLGKKFRYFSLALLWVAAVVALGYRLVLLTGQERDFLQHQSKARVNRTIKIPKKRGRILDRYGKVLAMSQMQPSVWVNPKELHQDKAAVKSIATLLGQNPQELTKKLEKNRKKTFLYLARRLEEDVAQKVYESRLAGLNIIEDFARFYPGGASASPLIGSVNIDGEGLEGIELMAQKKLSGEEGYKKVVINRYGETVQHMGQAAAKHGEDITLTIDKNVQYSAYKAVEEGVQESGAKRGMAVVLDVATGGVLAAVNYPSFDPSQRNVASDLRKNHAFTDLLEPGSTFKPVSMAYVLENHGADGIETINTAPGTWRLQKNIVKDVRNFGVLKVDDILMRSSNIGIAKLVLGCKKDFAAWLQGVYRVGVRSLPGYPGEPAGRVNHPQANQFFDIATMSYGYGVNMTVLQLASAYLQLANGGYSHQVQVVKGAAPHDHGPRILAEDTVARIKKMMRKVVSNRGTGRLGQVKGVEVAGKTGTTHVYTDKGYAEERYVASFSGFAPLAEPKYVITVVLEEPDKARHYGGQVAAPVFAKILFNLLYLEAR